MTPALHSALGKYAHSQEWLCYLNKICTAPLSRRCGIRASPSLPPFDASPFDASQGKQGKQGEQGKVQRRGKGAKEKRDSSPALRDPFDSAQGKLHDGVGGQQAVNLHHQLPFLQCRRMPGTRRCHRTRYKILHVRIHRTRRGSRLPESFLCRGKLDKIRRQGNHN